MRLGGASALVTGGASGLGLATARALLRSGAAVVLVDVNAEAGDHALRDLGAGSSFVSADVRDEDQIRQAIGRAASLAPLRVVVNCAGIGDPARAVGRDGPIGLDRFQRVVDINLVGTFNVIRLAAAEMMRLEPIDGERGVIVTTASVAAFDGQIGQASYAASKGAIAAMTLPLAREFAEHLIRVDSVAPGMFDTPILGGLSDDARESLARQVPHPSRLGAPDEFGDLVAHIVANPMLNGEVVRLDGALRMAPR